MFAFSFERNEYVLLVVGKKTTKGRPSAVDKKTKGRSAVVSEC
jgi:hypothetical protein